jgi:tripartite-type tricarboxylate transporter receptor subunit TctC
VTRYLRTPEASKPLAAQGADTAFSSADELLALIKSDLALWGKVIRDNNIRGE